VGGGEGVSGPFEQNEFMMPGSADSNKLIPGQQLGGLIAHSMQSQLAERRIPEMVVPLQGTDRSKRVVEPSRDRDWKQIDKRKNGGATAAGDCQRADHCHR
jgi:hypothetical protein